jgi:hypothetical protein
VALYALMRLLITRLTLLYSLHYAKGLPSYHKVAISYWRGNTSCEADMRSVYISQRAKLVTIPLSFFLCTLHVGVAPTTNSAKLVVDV